MNSTEAYVNASDPFTTVSIGNQRIGDIGLNVAVKYTYNVTDGFTIGINGYGMFFDDASESVTLSVGYKFLEE
ncbi:MAG: hypothetical protein ACQESL_04760 [Bacteroidota bacterium]